MSEWESVDPAESKGDVLWPRAGRYSRAKQPNNSVAQRSGLGARGFWQTKQTISSARGGTPPPHFCKTIPLRFAQEEGYPLPFFDKQNEQFPLRFPPFARPGGIGVHDFRKTTTPNVVAPLRQNTRRGGGYPHPLFLGSNGNSGNFDAGHGTGVCDSDFNDQHRG
jgi:hypothetical protein